MKAANSVFKEQNIEAFTISSFSGIPLCTKLFEQLFANIPKERKIIINHCSIKGFVNYSDKIINHPIKVFNSFDLFMSQSGFFKIRKYFQIAFRILIFILSKKMPVIYTIDINTCAISLFLKQFFFFRKARVIFHQFEMDIPENKSKIDRLFYRVFKGYSLGLDLFIVPEINRLKYFRNDVKLKDENCLIFPNTTYANAVKKYNNKTIIFGHVGALGPNHFIEPFLKAFSNIPYEAELLLIGRVSPDVHLMILKYSLTNVRIIEHVSHNELDDYYSKIDFGLILYRPVDLNNIYCAPNKIYEFWSYGIPVIAPELEGLIPLYKYPFMGKILNMESDQDLKTALNECTSAFAESSKYKLVEYFKSDLSINNYMGILENKIKKFN